MRSACLWWINLTTCWTNLENLTRRKKSSADIIFSVLLFFKIVLYCNKLLYNVWWPIIVVERLITDEKSEWCQKNIWWAVGSVVINKRTMVNESLHVLAVGLREDSDLLVRKMKNVMLSIWSLLTCYCVCVCVCLYLCWNDAGRRRRTMREEQQIHVRPMNLSIN